MSLEFEQYKLYVEMAEGYGVHRLSVDRFYVTVIAALYATVSIVAAATQGFANLQGIQREVIIAVGLLSIGLCVGWGLDMRSFIQMKKIKWDIINELEEESPYLSRCWVKERERYNALIEKTILFKLLGKSHEHLLEMREWYLPLILTMPSILLIVSAYRMY